MLTPEMYKEGHPDALRFLENMERRESARTVSNSDIRRMADVVGSSAPCLAQAKAALRLARRGGYFAAANYLARVCEWLP